MMRRTIVPLALFLAFGAQAAEKAWVEESNEHAQVLLKVLAQFAPEFAGRVGVEGFDTEVIDLKPKAYERSRKTTQNALAELQKRLQGTADPAVRQDLEIMIEEAQQMLRTDELEHDLLLPYISVARTVFEGIHTLLDPRVAKERQAKAVDRLRRYAGVEREYEPITELAKARSTERFKEKNLLGPYRGEVEQHLADTPRLIAGIQDLFRNSGLAGYEEALAALEKQLQAYDEWLRAEMLPRARKDSRLPPALYANNLRRVGVDIAPELLMQKALVSFAEIRNEMRVLAPLVAKEKKLKSRDYRDVIRELKAKQVYGEAVLPLYKKRLYDIERIVAKEEVVSLPQRQAVIRMASAAETAMIPAPHMSPPRLIGNTGERGEFVLPLNVPGKAGEQDLKTDDFTHDAGTWTLTVHEARPGHEMQFAAMIEKGVSIARGVFAFNSVNAEGWALYAEAEMKPYLPLDGQLIALQHRLMRAARAFLDPMLNLGLITQDEVKAVLMEDVVLSEAMAKQEVDRYTFRAPGQATSYFYGYQRLMEIRQKAELALRDQFQRKAFHDFVLAQGLLPPRLLEKAVLDEFVPNSRSAIPAGAVGAASAANLRGRD